MNKPSGSGNTLKIIIAILTLITAGVHLTLLFPNPLFILNSLGYLALLAAYLLPIPIVRDYRGLVRWVYIGFTAVTIIAWIAIGDKTWIVGYITKAVEILLIIALLRDRPE